MQAETTPRNRVKLTREQAIDTIAGLGRFPRLHTDALRSTESVIKAQQVAPARIAWSRALEGKQTLLQGGYGTGKTYIACLMAMVWYERGMNAGARYWTQSGLLADQKSWYAKHEGTEPMRQATACGLLALDEMLPARMSEHDQAAIRELIDARYRNKRATLLITNLTQEGLLEALDDPTLDRCLEGGNGIVEIDGGSLRGAAQ